MKIKRVLSFLLAVAVCLTLLSSCDGDNASSSVSSGGMSSENTSSVADDTESEDEEIPAPPDDSVELPEGSEFSLSLYNHPTAVKDEYIYVLKEEAPEDLKQKFTLIRSNPVTKKNGIFMEFEYTFSGNQDVRYFESIAFAGKGNRYLLVKAREQGDRFIIDTATKKTYGESAFKEAFNCEIKWQTDTVSAQVYRYVETTKTPAADENGIFEVWKGTHAEYGSSAHLNMTDYIDHTGDSMIMTFKNGNTFTLLKYSYADRTETVLSVHDGAINVDYLGENCVDVYSQKEKKVYIKDILGKKDDIIIDSEDAKAIQKFKLRVS